MGDTLKIHIELMTHTSVFRLGLRIVFDAPSYTRLPLIQVDMTPVASPQRTVMEPGGAFVAAYVRVGSAASRR